MAARVITATAPVRICDIGGWTDTWFAGTGAVFSVAVEPGVEAQVRVAPTAGAGEVALDAPDLGERYRYPLGAPPGRLPLLEAAIARSAVPPGLALALTVRAGVPPGCGTGTSAAVVVAALAALDRLTPGTAGPLELARSAHLVETEELGQQSGVQDQLASAVGGVNLLEVRYPDAAVHPVVLDPAVRDALQARLLLVWLGRPHRSSAVHEDVITRLTTTGAGAAELEALRRLAREAAGAAAAGDLEGLAAAMRAGTEAQRRLHPALVSGQAQALVDAARAAGATGWKVNGAGGDGGSLTLLAGPGPGATAAVTAALAAVTGGHAVLPIRLAGRGLHVTDTG